MTTWLWNLIDAWERRLHPPVVFRAHLPSLKPGQSAAIFWEDGQ